MNPISYRRYRFPSAVIQHAVWLYCRFTPSYRDIEDIPVERGVDVSYETVRRWVLKFGAAYAKRLSARRLKPCSTWHIDEVFVQINGKQMNLWRAVDAEGEVLDVLLQSKRNKTAASRFLRRTMKRRSMVPVEIVSNKWQASAAAVREIAPSATHVRGKSLNNRAENSHQPTRRREQKLQSFTSAKSAQRFLFLLSTVYNRFNIGRHLIFRMNMRQFRANSFAEWLEATKAA